MKTGEEQFSANAKGLGFTLKDFWAWNSSDLLSNITRGRLAEFIVAKALNIRTDVARDEWDSCDLTTPDGIKIEVKSSAYVQGWKQKQLSRISFDTRPTRCLDERTGLWSKEAIRHAHIYVFALLAHKELSTVEPMNVAQWEFYVMSTKALNGYSRSQSSITLKSLERESGGLVDYFGLAAKVKSVLA